VLIPPPRKHRHRYHGVLAPNAALRGAVTSRAGQPVEGRVQPAPARGTDQAPERWRRPAAYLWVALIARIYECLPLSCPRCGAEMRLIAFLTEPTVVKPILVHLGWPSEPPRVALPRDPPLDDLDQTPAFDPADPEPVRIPAKLNVDSGRR
jgi:hypothetical protein